MTATPPKEPAMPELSTEDRALNAAAEAFDNRYDGTNHEAALEVATRAAYRSGIIDGLAAAAEMTGAR